MPEEWTLSELGNQSQAAAPVQQALVGGLPMYDLPGCDAANDALWHALVQATARRGMELPKARSRGPDQSALAAGPGLTLAQICGLPFAKAPTGTLQLVATPVYHAPGCVGAAYRSVLIGPAGSTLAEAAAGVAAINEPGSQSGHLALRRTLALLRGVRPEQALLTGSHRASVHAVAAKQATLAAIDCVSWALIKVADRSAAAAVEVLGVSPAAPGLPLVTRADLPAAQVAALRGALVEVLADPSLDAVRRQLHLVGMERVDEAAYRRLLALEAAAPKPLV
ncbi:MAG: PhnD/SsuA/transferrin family substrate-binding protein [Pseudomonadota bacterium]